MRVLHLSYSDLRGGAAIGANRLHSTLRNYGASSEMLVVDRITNDPSVKKITDSTTNALQVFANRQSRDLKSLYQQDDLSIRSLNLVGVNVAEIINDSDCDLVHFHWIAGNTIRLIDLPKIEKPIVWKMPDMWPFSGAEHYIDYFDEPRYKLGYDKTDAEHTSGVDIDRIVWELKRSCYADLPLTVASPSRFLAKCAHESVLLSPYDAHVVPNPLPDQFLLTNALSGQERLQLRLKHRLPLNRKLCVFAAFSSAEKRKGYHHLEEALAKHLPARMSPDEVGFIIIGGAEHRRERVHGYEVFHVPRIDVPSEYIDLLKCADAMVCPSEMDSTAMVVQEANAVGIPSIVFDVGGMPEMVTHKRNGFVAKPYDAAEIAEGIEWSLKEGRADQMADYARATAQMMHDSYQCASRYIDVYEQSIRRYRGGESFKTGTLHDREIEKDAPAPETRTIHLIDPSVLSHGDTAHNTEVALAFSAAFAGAGYRVVWLSNKNSTAENPYGPTHRIMPYTAYDKIRSSSDSREGYSHGEMEGFEDANWPPEREIFDILSAYFDEQNFTFRDAIFVPMVDRILLDALCAVYLTNKSLNFPKLFLNFMFEKGNFLTGGYPLEEMARRLKALKGFRNWVFPCVETVAMAETMNEHFGVLPLVVKPPHLFESGFVKSQIAALPPTQGAQLTTSYQKAEELNAPSASKFAPEKPEGEIWVGAFGRGRRDKGWARLPGIVSAFNALGSNANVKFIAQKPRAMDKLDAELAQMSKLPNVILLDEMIDNDQLDGYSQACDIFLLPYEKSVYGNRGSAFIWRGVALEKPIVVSRQTGLEDGLLSGNGLAASDEKEFAQSIERIIEDFSTFKDNAERAAELYFQNVAVDNPVIARLDRRGFNAKPINCYVVADDMSAEQLTPHMSEGAVSVVVRIGAHTEDDVEGALATFNWNIDFAKDATPIPGELLKRALHNVSFSEILIDDRLICVPGMVDALGGARAIERFVPLGNVDADSREGSLQTVRLGRWLAPSLADSLARVGDLGANAIVRLLSARQRMGQSSPVTSLKQLSSLVEQIEDGPDSWEGLGLSSEDAAVLIRVAALELSSVEAPLDVNGKGAKRVSDHVLGASYGVKGNAELILPTDDLSAQSLIVIQGRLERPKSGPDFVIEFDGVDGDVSLRSDGAGRFVALCKPAISQPSGKLRLRTSFLGAGKADHQWWIRDKATILQESPQLQYQVEGKGEQEISLIDGIDPTFDSEVIVSGTEDADGAADATLELDGHWVPSKYTSDGTKWTHRLLVTGNMVDEGILRVHSASPLAWSSVSVRPVGTQMVSSDVKTSPGISVGEIDRINDEKPRSRFAKWQILLRNVRFDEAVFEEVRLQIVVHDGQPFLALNGKDFTRSHQDGGRFGDQLRIFPHRESVFEEAVAGLSAANRRLLSELASALPGLIERAKKDSKSYFALHEAAVEIAEGLKIWPIYSAEE